MLPEEDDGTESSGPPPDPSLREWRHPSEIAAAKAAAARPATPSSRSIASPLITFGGAAVSVAAIIGLGLYLSGGGLSQQATQQFTIDDPTTPPPATTSLVSRTSQLPDDETTDGAGEVVAGGTDDGSDSIDTLDDAPTEDGVNTTTSAAPSPQATTGSVTVSSTTAPVDLLAPERRPALAPTSDGIYGLVDGEQLERLGGFLVVDGLVYSTGTAIGTRTELAIGGESGWATATLIGVDPVTDVAVLDVGETADGYRADGDTADGTGEVGPEADVGEQDNTAEADGDRPVSPNDPMLGRRVEVGGITDDRSAAGLITAVGQPATVTDGHVVYGALRTSIPRQDNAGGSPLLDSKGDNPIGMVIDSNDPLLSAIPLRTLRAIGESFVSVGQPAVEWLGIRGNTHGDGGVVIAEIISGGPAEAAGLLEGDVILTVDNRPLASMNHLAHLIRRAGPDTAVRLQLRDGQRRRTVTVTVGTRPPGPSGS